MSIVQSMFNYFSSMCKRRRQRLRTGHLSRSPSRRGSDTFRHVPSPVVSLFQFQRHNIQPLRIRRSCNPNFIKRGSGSIGHFGPPSLLIPQPTLTFSPHPTPVPQMSIVSAFQKSGLIPDVVPSSEPFKPSVSFSVLYPNEPKPFTTGVEMPRETTLGEPEISRVSLEEGKGHTYTLVMTDPDVPSRVNKELGEFRHWLVSIILRVDSVYL